MFTEAQIKETDEWLIEHGVDDIECIVPDCAGIARGKAMPRTKFIAGLRSGGHRMPETVFSLTINGSFVFNEYIHETDRDVLLTPDLSTLCMTPWQPEPMAAVICDAVFDNGKPVPYSPRQVLRRVLDAYTKKDWAPIVAPEYEFYLLSREEGIQGKPMPPVGASGRRSGFNNPLSIDALDEFTSYFDDIYDACEAQHINVDTLTHEADPAQFEFNVLHGDALNVADQSFLFKRIIRQIAIKHGLFATFMASPYSDTFGSAMHIHQSVTHVKTGNNIFPNADGSNADIFLKHIAGLQNYLPQALPLLAPYVNSYRRFRSGWSSPTNTHWGRENRSVGLRVPAAPEQGRRVENRIAGSDVNPYLAIAASLACGYLGMIEDTMPSAPYKGSAFEDHNGSLPQHFLDGLENFKKCDPLRELITPDFVETYVGVKMLEYESYSAVLSPWETENLLFTV